MCVFGKRSHHRPLRHDRVWGQNRQRHSCAADAKCCPCYFTTPSWWVWAVEARFEAGLVCWIAHYHFLSELLILSDTPIFFTSPLGIRKIYFSPCQCSLARVNYCYILHWKISSVKWGSGGYLHVVPTHVYRIEQKACSFPPILKCHQCFPNFIFYGSFAGSTRRTRRWQVRSDEDRALRSSSRPFLLFLLLLSLLNLKTSMQNRGDSRLWEHPSNPNWFTQTCSVVSPKCFFFGVSLPLLWVMQVILMAIDYSLVMTFGSWFFGYISSISPPSFPHKNIRKFFVVGVSTSSSVEIIMYCIQIFIFANSWMSNFQFWLVRWWLVRPPPRSGGFLWCR